MKYFAFFLTTLVFLFNLNFSSYSQNNSIDSLENLLNKAKEKEKAGILNQLSGNYLKVSPEKSLEYGLLAKKFAVSYDKVEIEIDAIINIGHAYYLMASYDSAVNFYNMALPKAKEKNLEEKIAINNRQLGSIFWHTNDYEKSLTHFLDALTYYEKVNNYESIAAMQNSIGLVFLNLNKGDEALDFFNKALEFCIKDSNEIRIAQVENNIGLIYYQKEEYNEALVYFLKSLRTKERLNRDDKITTTLNNIGEIYGSLGKEDSALIYFQRGLQISKEKDTKRITAGTLQNIGKILLQQKKYTEAAKHFEESIEIASETNARKVLIDNYFSFYKLYQETKDYKTACNYIELYSKGYEELFNEEMSSKITDLQIKYETKQKDNAIILLSKEKDIEKYQNQKNRILRNLLFLMLVFFLLFTLKIIRDIRQKKKLNSLLYQKNYFMQTILDTNPNPQFYKNEKGEYVGCNKSFEKITGYNKNELIGKKVTDIIDLKSSCDHEEIDKELFENLGTKKYMCYFEKKDEKWEFELVKTVYESEPGVIGGILGIMVDVTHFKKQEKKIREQENLIYQQEKDKLKTDLENKETELANKKLRLLKNSKYIAQFIDNLNALNPYTNKEGQSIIRTTISEYRSLIEDKNWDDFELRFKETNKEFYEKLVKNYPDLTKNEIKVCILLYLKLPTKDIADITFKNIRTIENSRTRIRNKMNITGVDENLNEFLAQL